LVGVLVIIFSAGDKLRYSVVVVFALDCISSGDHSLARLLTLASISLAPQNADKADFVGVGEEAVANGTSVKTDELALIIILLLIAYSSILPLPKTGSEDAATRHGRAAELLMLG